MKYYFYEDTEKGNIGGYSIIPDFINDTEEVNPAYIEVENPPQDLLDNFVWYKFVDGEFIKMNDEEFYSKCPNYGKYIPTETELLGQMATDAELERMEIGQRMTDLELMVLEGGM